jgi:uncharacterized membrane protein
MLLRWFHFLAGITWIGILYYFNFIQTPFFAETDPAVRSGAVQKLLPRALRWFRWGAMLMIPVSGLSTPAIPVGYAAPDAHKPDRAAPRVTVTRAPRHKWA